MRSYRKILLLAVVVGVLSLISTSASFFREDAYGWSWRCTRASETREIAIIAHGFPICWYSEVRGLRGGYLEYEFFEFHPIGFLFDVFAYIILHSVTVAVALSLYKDRDVRKLFSNLKPSSRKTACARA